jgi:hypothetical protein
MGSARRSFLMSLAGAPLLPAALAQAAPNPVALQVAPNPPAPASPTPSPSDAPSPMAEALAEAARHRFGAHFAPGDLGEIRKAIHGNLRAADRLHAMVKLTNADEPVTTFAAQPPGAVPREQPAPRPRRR